MSEQNNEGINVEDLYNELMSTQLMLGHVLAACGDVLVTREEIESGLPEGKSIEVAPNADPEGFIIRLVDAPEVSD